MATTYIYVWKNNSRRREYYGRECTMIHTMKRNTVILRFLDTGEYLATSRQAVRKVNKDTEKLSKHTRICAKRAHKYTEIEGDI